MDEQQQIIPNHLGFILDGNRRWARMHSIPEFDGHLAGYSALKEVIDETFDQGVKYVSVYVFSTENWKRETKQVVKLMRLVMTIITRDLKEITRKGIRVRFLGRPDGLSAKMLAAIEKAEEKTRDYPNGTLAFCFNYGGQQEITDAVKKCIRDGLKPEEVTEQTITDRLYAPDMPPIDMVVRSSGEQRLSNFMLWRSAYSEFMFIEKYWPDMTKTDVADIIEEYNRRGRRFGG